MIFLLLSMTSCTKNPCIGLWKGGRNNDVAEVRLLIEKDGTCELESYPHGEKIAISEINKYTYYGNWHQETENTIAIEFFRGKHTIGYNSTDVQKTPVAYFRSDGALWIDNKSFKLPDYNMIKKR